MGGGQWVKGGSGIMMTTRTAPTAPTPISDEEQPVGRVGRGAGAQAARGAEKLRAAKKSGAHFQTFAIVLLLFDGLEPVSIHAR